MNWILLFLIVEIIGTVLALAGIFKENDRIFLVGYFLIIIPALVVWMI